MSRAKHRIGYENGYKEQASRVSWKKGQYD